jgi:hypothetical protein
LTFPKFIIEDGKLILGNVKYHNDFVTDKTKVIGGGWFKLKEGENTYILSGDSHEFGRAKMEDVNKCIISDNVFEFGSTISIAKQFTFEYRDGY